MDIVYICREGDNEELRYSLRSLKNIEHDKVWLVGGKPKWFKADFIPTPQKGNKHRVVNFALRTICLTPEISDPFILFNDDFFVTEPVVLEHYDRGLMRDVIQEYVDLYNTSYYIRGLQNTLTLLEKREFFNPKCYELHVPMIVRKRNMLKALELSKVVSAPAYRTIYGMISDLDSTTIQDVKVMPHNKDWRPDGAFLSSNDDTFCLLKDELQEMFSEPSEFEFDNK